ncbi:hypothetical protein NliqN6_4450 [Naganishia liquefaciens]|uniref:tRNA (guanine(10)-N(2))-methyltransferase n=1 Tax=Naganishia liquefaciens TaxID=104408 RepID=A0A8H3TVV0_9TREE|nr:hypothetical protein NliqN6_4450 [Naganishia liquefaciens]
MESKSHSNACPQRYLLHLARTHPTFRIPDLDSCARFFGFGIRLLATGDYFIAGAGQSVNNDNGSEWGIQVKSTRELEDAIGRGSSALVVIEFTEGRGVYQEHHGEVPLVVNDVDQTDEWARILTTRCIMLKAISHAFSPVPSSPNYSHLRKSMEPRRELWQADEDAQKEYSFELVGINRKIGFPRRRDTIENFAFMGLTAKANLKKPQVTYMVYEEYEESAFDLAMRNSEEGAKTKVKLEEATEGIYPLRIFMGRLVAYGQARSLIQKFIVKERKFYGNTSMESEMSLLMAGQTLSDNGKIIYDPFAGTGSLLYTCAHWGSYVMGSDIDGRQMRGKDKSGPGVFRAAQQYGIRDKMLDCLTFDVTRNPWRRGELLDAIITDPPYGVRAGAKRLGRKVGRKKLITEPVMLPNGVWSHEAPGYIPASKPYEMVDLVNDLVMFARYMLVPGGRLVFFLPTFTEEWDPVDLPTIEGMREISFGQGSAQEFNKWSRRLITMEKYSVRDANGEEKKWDAPNFVPLDVEFEEMGLEDDDRGERDEAPRRVAKVPGHANFRERYVTGFPSTPTTPLSED